MSNKREAPSPDFLTKLSDNKLFKQLYRHALVLIKQPDMAEDLVQDTLLKALTYHYLFEPNTNFNAWIYTILKNNFYNIKRSRWHQNMSDTEDLTQAIDNLKTSVEPEVWKLFRDEEINKILKNARPEFAAPITLLMQGYKYNEVAKKLGLSDGTVKNRIFYARRAFSGKKVDRNIFISNKK